MKFLDGHLVYAANLDKTSPPFQPLARLPLVIVVGLTGVGKSTITGKLAERLNFTLLPNRRQITDAVIIASLQQADGAPVQPVTDRIKRMEYTARYRRQYPGGMAHALSRFAINLDHLQPPILFDGIRGLDEVQGAVEFFPQARILVLDAPDTVRLNRLLNRGDSFDQVRFATPPNESLIDALRSIPTLDAVFSEADLHQISVSLTGLPVEAVVAKAALIVKERHNYDSNTAKAYLIEHLPPKRVLVMDTFQLRPDEIVQRLLSWL